MKKLLDAIEASYGKDCHINKDGVLVHGANSAEDLPLFIAEDVFEALRFVTPAKQQWIPVTERLPEEHESIFAKIYATEKWEPYMFLMTSDDVLAVVKFEDGSSKVKVVRTTDGEWRLLNVFRAKEVTHWMPLPEPPKGENNEAK